MKHFRIADTVTDSVAKLTCDEQKAVKTATFDLQMNAAHPGLKLHQVDRARAKDFWSARVSRDMPLIDDHFSYTLTYGRLRPLPQSP